MIRHEERPRLSRKFHISIIGNGFVGSAHAKFLAGKAKLTIWDKKSNNPYPIDDVAESDLVIVCVNTPTLPSGECDISFVCEAVKSIPLGPTVLIRSTIPPGTTQQLEKKFQRHITFAPEYIGETGVRHAWGDDLSRVPHFILGGTSEARRTTLEVLAPLLPKGVEIFQCTSTEAEVIKLMENAFLATKVAFVNELYDYCVAIDADWEAVREGWIKDVRIGQSHTCVYVDSRGFGGSCLPKDLKSLEFEMKRHGIDPILVQGVLQSNSRVRQLNDQP